MDPLAEYFPGAKRQLWLAFSPTRSSDLALTCAVVVVVVLLLPMVMAVGVSVGDEASSEGEQSDL